VGSCRGGKKEVNKYEGDMDSSDVTQLLVEIRDIQRDQLEEYRRVTKESLELSRRAVQKQEQLGRLYQRVVAVGTLILIGLGFYLAWISGAFG
jgi:CHASE3 domain sensor protein